MVFFSHPWDIKYNWIPYPYFDLNKFNYLFLSDQQIQLKSGILLCNLKF